MNALDIVILVFVLLAVARGVRAGFLVGAFSLAGVALGAALGSRLAPMLVPENESPMIRLGITLVTILALAVLGEILARTVGGSLRNRLRSPASAALDGLGGALLGLAISLTFVWVVGIFVLQTPPLARLQPTIEGSRVLATLNERMPSDLLSQAVASLDPLPQLQGPEPEVSGPDGSVAGDPEVLAASESVVRVSGVACGYRLQGSGWLAAPNLVVTNAHVIAGEDVTRVRTTDGVLKRAEVVVFDRKNDVAVLRVGELGVPVLPLVAPERGEEVAVIGYPEGGPLDVVAGRTGVTREAISGNAYNERPVERTVTSFRAPLFPGNSGGPAVNAEGEVVSTIFASRAGSNDSGYGIPSGIVQQRLEQAANRTEPVDTGRCIR